MEIHILLAGVEFGPYTDAAARQLIGEGFLSASDPAKRLNETDWIPLNEVLARGETAAPAPPEKKPAIVLSRSEEKPAPPEKPISFIQAPEKTFPKPQLREEPVAAPAPEEKSQLSPSTAFTSQPIRKTSFAPHSIATTSPFISVSLPSRNKPKGAVRTTGSLLAKEALQAAQARAGGAPPSSPPPPPPPPPSPTPSSSETKSTATAPLARPRLKSGEASKTAPVPRQPIRLTQPLSVTRPAPTGSVGNTRLIPGTITTTAPLQTNKILLGPKKEAPDRRTEPLPAPGMPEKKGMEETEEKTPITASLTNALAERRSLKITGALRQSEPRTPVRLTTRLPSQPVEPAPGMSESKRLPGPLDERKAERPPPLPTILAATDKMPRTAALVETPRPATGKIPVSEMPPEGIKIRSRRPTSAVTLPPETAEPPSAPAKITPPETAALPETDAPSETTALKVARPEQVRLRRPVKLELSSKAKLQDSGRLTLEAFSKMATQDVPPTIGGPAIAPAIETAPEDEPHEVVTLPPAELAAPEEFVSPEEDFHPPRLTEASAPPFFLSSKSKQPFVWIFYIIISLGLVATLVLIYLGTHRSLPAPSVSSSVTVTNTAPEPAPAPAAAAPEPKPAAPAPAPTPALPDVSSQVNVYVSEGTTKYQAGDLDGALAAFNHAIDLDPKSAVAIFHRGLTKAAQNDFDGAVADYSQAIQLDSQMAAAFYNRGVVRHSKGDLEGAIRDYNQGLQLDPKNALAFFNRGLIRMQQDNIDGAIVDASRALDLDPRLIQGYYNRGLGRLAKGTLDAALSDLKTFCQLAPQDNYTDYARLYIWLIRTQQNQLAEATQELTKAMKSGWNGASDGMVTKIGQFLLGQISENDLIAASASTVPVKDQGQRCEAWYFIGMRRLEAGDKEGAAIDLRKCVETQKTDYCEYILAQEKLRELSAGTTATPAAVTAPAATTPASALAPAK